MSQTKAVTGIILCGGESSRMGQNKALLKIKGKYIISYVIDTLQPFCDEIILSTNTKELDFLGYQTVNDKFKNIGPISGIYSALLESNNSRNIIISCDTPFINSHLLTDLLFYSEDYDIVLPEFNGYLQTMIGIFNKTCILVIEREISKGNYIPPRIYEQCNLNKLKITDKHPFYHQHLFFNVNSPEDFRKAQEIIKNIKV